MKLALILIGLISSTFAFAETRFVQIKAATREERSTIANLGISIESVMSDSVWGFASDEERASLRQNQFKILGDFTVETGRGGHDSGFDFPAKDEKFHTYAQMEAALFKLQSENSELVKIQSIGKSFEGRDLWAAHINSSVASLASGTSGKPGVVFMGAHHAREHLSLEVPLMLAQYLLQNKTEPKIARLLNERDIWIMPLINPDGAEFDISKSKYQLWRKNRSDNHDRSFGVDLNRNYGFKWGTGGSSTRTSSEVYRGPAPFSELETQAVRDFVDSHLNLKTLLSFHSYSELILYPWGHTFEAIGNARDLSVFKKMARTMAQWNHYTPEASSALYIASGDTTDWAYGEHGIFAFTFELSPATQWAGGFYPGEKVIDRVFQDNLVPCLYLLDVTADPYQVIDARVSPGLSILPEPAIPVGDFWQP